MIRRDTLFKGCTRPAMMFGVPLIPLFSVSILFFLLSMLFKFYLIFLLPIPILIMRLIAKEDDQVFRLIGLKFYFRLFPNTNFNQGFWKASVYSPIQFKKR